MTTIKTYYPKPVLLPKGIRRDIEYSKTLGREEPLTKRDYEIFDGETLFYDVFFQSNRLVCIAPPFYNLGYPLAIRYKGKNLDFKIVRQYNLNAPEIIFIRVHPKQAAADLEFVFKDFTINIRCDCRPTIPLPAKTLTLTTLQKDNPLVWIRDWLSWHIRAYGVERVVLYDNGSRYWGELNKRLAKLNEEVEVILVNWPYKHGSSVYGKWNYGFCHQGMLEHFRLSFGCQTIWCLYLDIDEFLYFEDELLLREYLRLPRALSRPTIYLHHYLFPAGQQPAKQQARFYHSQMRYHPKYWCLNTSRKYICQPSMIARMNLHYTVHLRIPFRIALALRESAYTQMKLRWRSFRAMLLSKYYYAIVNLKKRNTFVFYHFRDLYTGWRDSALSGRKDLKKHKMQPLSSINPNRLVNDRRVIDRAIEMKLVSKSLCPPPPPQ